MNRSHTADELLIKAFARLHKTALGVAIGSLLGLAVFVATNILLLKGGEVVGPHFSLLGQFFLGYSVTFAGSLIGYGYGFVAGFLIGWLTAFLHNLFISIYLYLVQLKANVASITSYIDPDHL